MAMPNVAPLSNVPQAVRQALVAPVAGPALRTAYATQASRGHSETVCVVVPDNTRPLQCTGPRGVLWPVVEELLRLGVPGPSIKVVVATGTHRTLHHAELRQLIDSRVWESGAEVLCHDCDSTEGLVLVGTSSRGTEARVNRVYVESAFRVILGLVESHFMAGVSGGRKMICPGLLGRESVRVFHGAAMLDSPGVEDLCVAGNPCHAEALEIARIVPPQYTLNFTCRGDGELTGAFGGELERCHEAAAEWLKSYVVIPIEREYDLVVIHGGHVGLNHYQAAKAAVSGARAVRPGGGLVVVADTVDTDVVGSDEYRAMLALLSTVGPQAFRRLVLSDDWTFVPDQWQVQMWAKVFTRIPAWNFAYFSPQTTAQDYRIIPGLGPSDVRCDLGPDAPAAQRVAEFVERALLVVEAKIGLSGSSAVRVGYCPDGPFGIPALAGVKPACGPSAPSRAESLV